MGDTGSNETPRDGPREVLSSDSSVPDPRPGDGPSTVGLHGECDQKRRRCGAGLLCLGNADEGWSSCLQECTKTPSICAKNTDGRTKCRQMGPNLSLCLDMGGESEACGLKLSKLCETGFACHFGRCLKFSPHMRYRTRCNPSAGVYCISPERCVKPSKDSDSYCFSTCKPKETECHGIYSGVCVALSDGSKACLPYGLRAADRKCLGAPAGSRMNIYQGCRKGLVCIRLNPKLAEGLCAPEVAACGAGACAAGRSCLPLVGGRGACVKTCTTEQDCPVGSCKAQAQGIKACSL